MLRESYEIDNIIYFIGKTQLFIVKAGGTEIATVFFCVNTFRAESIVGFVQYFDEVAGKMFLLYVHFMLCINNA
jgi:hypothetical protein